jgi:hypothetical protein
MIRNSPTFDAATAMTFLRQRYRDDEPACLVIDFKEGIAIPPGGPDRFAAALARAEREQKHLFFHVADVATEWADPASHAKGRITTAAKTQVIQCPFLWLDCDPEKYYGSDPVEAAAHYVSQGIRVAKRIEDGLAAVEITPFAKWRSGAGWQALVKLNEPITPDEAEGLVAKLHVLLGFDAVVKNSNRILRVPGSINWKNGKDGRVPAECSPCEFIGATTSVERVRAILTGSDSSIRTSGVVKQVNIDWSRVADHAGWLKSAADLPNDFPRKGRIIVGHSGTLADLNESLAAAGLLRTKYASWSDVTFALAAVFKTFGRFPAEQIAAALVCKLPCNQHLLKFNDSVDKTRHAVERTIMRSYGSAVTAPSNEKDDRPVIEWIPHLYPDILDRIEAIFVKREVGLFQANGRLVHTYRHNVEHADDNGVVRKAGALLISDVPSTRLNEYMTTNCNFVQYADDDKPPKKLPAPKMLSEHYLGRRDLWRLPVLTGLVECPTLRADGSLLSAQGYDGQSGLMLDTNGVEYPTIPENPSHADAIAAIAKLKDALGEFPFVDDASRSVALSAILTTLVRRQMSIAPVHGFDANSPSTGKSLLADVVSYLATGRPCAAMTLPTAEEESVKAWLSILRNGDPVISIDNVDVVITGGTICKIVTQQIFEARVLGVNEMSKVATNVSILCNGNNLAFGADMAVRAIKARMDAGMEHPDRRKFARNLHQYIPEHRPELVAAALTVLRGYIYAGRPFTAEPSRFAEWDLLPRGALIWCGEADPQDTRAEIDDLDPARADLAAIIDALRRCFGIERTATSQEIVTRAAQPDSDGQALNAALRPHMAGVIQSRGVTAVLTRNTDTIVNGNRIRRRKDRKAKIAIFWIENITPPLL